MSNMSSVSEACVELGININSKTPPILTLETIKILLARISSIVDSNTKNRDKEFRTKYNFTIVKQNGEITFRYPMRMEEILERMIVKAWDNIPGKIANQFALNKNNSKEDIDLVLHNGTEVKTIVELKYGSNTPMFAVLEVIKNYLILKKGDLHREVEELTILAPKFFYDKFTDLYIRNVTEIIKIIRRVDPSIPRISLKYINISSGGVEKTILDILSNKTTQCSLPIPKAKGAYHRISSFEQGTLITISGPLTDWLPL